MKRYSLKNDYSEGAHPEILQAINKINLIQHEGYGNDELCVKAKELIRDHIRKPQADIHFVSSGTQANLISISSILKPYESVIASVTAHIAVHETGAIEATGHKINTIETVHGKLSPEDIIPVIDFHTDEHMVKPKLVFISNSTEVGSIYTKDELEKLYSFCQKSNLYLYIDGARLGSALTSASNDMTLSELSGLADIFYIGGTKNGAMFGEAIVILNENLKNNFRFHVKQKGGLLAKGKYLGIQFSELFKDDLYFKLAGYANQISARLSEAISKCGYKFWLQPVSNQIFPILPDQVIKKLQKNFDFYVWKKYDENHSVIRLVTSWATTEEVVDKFLHAIKSSQNSL